MFRLKEVGLALDSRECVILTKRRRGELEELRYPALAQVRGAEIRAIGQRAHRRVGKSRDVITVFPGRVEDPMILGEYLQRVFPRRSKLERRRIVGERSYWHGLPIALRLAALLRRKPGAGRNRARARAPGRSGRVWLCRSTLGRRFAQSEDGDPSRREPHVGWCLRRRRSRRSRRQRGKLGSSRSRSARNASVPLGHHAGLQHVLQSRPVSLAQFLRAQSVASQHRPWSECHACRHRPAFAARRARSGRTRRDRRAGESQKLQRTRAHRVRRRRRDRKPRDRSAAQNTIVQSRKSRLWKFRQAQKRRARRDRERSLCGPRDALRRRFLRSRRVDAILHPAVAVSLRVDERPCRRERLAQDHDVRTRSQARLPRSRQDDPRREPVF